MLYVLIFIHSLDQDMAARHRARFASVQIIKVSEVSDADHNEDDCHHCGHCHGSHMQWVYFSQHFTHPIFNNSTPFQYAELARNHIIDHDLRPPIT